MISALRSILDVIKTFIDFVIHSVESVLNILAAIPRFTTYVFNLVNNLVPDVLKPFIILSVITGIILLILGRNK